jgi:hypothetical protein
MAAMTDRREVRHFARIGKARTTMVTRNEPDTDREWLAEFEAAANRSLETRMRYAFVKTYKPVLDDAPYRSFETMQEYRRWCEENLPSWLGYGRV